MLSLIRHQNNLKTTCNTLQLSSLKVLNMDICLQNVKSVITFVLCLIYYQPFPLFMFGSQSTKEESKQRAGFLLSLLLKLWSRGNYFQRFRTITNGRFVISRDVTRPVHIQTNLLQDFFQHRPAAARNSVVLHRFVESIEGRGC